VNLSIIKGNIKILLYLTGLQLLKLTDCGKNNMGEELKNTIFDPVLPKMTPQK
jgi:hypothetical protein